MITKQEIEKLANLARIKVNQDEIDSLASDIGSILSYVDEIKKVNMNIDSKANIGAVNNIFREDKSVSSTPETIQAIMNESPDREGDFIAVKKIISQD
jgi:aspartyl-tRNA(Asn)/glutamyl-tRNA(Gln) amidotransferase subunit C